MAPTDQVDTVSGLLWLELGRLPLVVQLQDLDEDALVRILTEPQGAIVKQYQALFGFQDVDLSFTDEALREVRVALLEADVALPVVKDFVAKARERAVGEEVIRSVKPSDMIVKIVHDGLVDMLGGTTPEPLNLNVAPPAVILMTGLQGSGKTTTSGKLVFGIFAALAEFERELISERTKAGLASARARGRKGGRPYKMTPAKIRLAMASMGNKDTNVGALCKELGITRQTLYRHVSPTGELREAGQKVLAQRR